MKLVVDMSETLSGMRLVEDIKTSNGSILIAKETVLTDKHLLILKSKGIKNITIYKADESLGEAGLAKEIERIDRLFAPHAGLPVMAQIKAILIRHFEKQV